MFSIHWRNIFLISVDQFSNFKLCVVPQVDAYLSSVVVSQKIYCLTGKADRRHGKDCQRWLVMCLAFQLQAHHQRYVFFVEGRTLDDRRNLLSQDSVDGILFLHGLKWHYINKHWGLRVYSEWYKLHGLQTVERRILFCHWMPWFEIETEMHYTLTNKIYLRGWNGDGNIFLRWRVGMEMRLMGMGAIYVPVHISSPRPTT